MRIQGFSRADLPDAKVMVITEGKEPLAIGGETYGTGATELAVYRQSIDFPAVFRIPQPQGVVEAGGDHP